MLLLVVRGVRLKAVKVGLRALALALEVPVASKTGIDVLSFKGH